MYRSTWPRANPNRSPEPTECKRLRTDGGRENGRKDGEQDDGSDGNGTHESSDEEENGNDGNGDDASAIDRAGVEVTEAGEAEPADPKWEKPDLDDLPEFELRADEPVARGESSSGDAAGESESPTAGMPNTAQTPGTRLKEEGTEGYIAALELCARLPDDVRLPEGAADLVPVAIEAEIEQDIQAFAAAEFDNQSPSVDTLAFVERDEEVWLRLRLGVSPEAFADLDPEAIRTHALQQLEGMF
jgi:hypothetical protein